MAIYITDPNLRYKHKVKINKAYDLGHRLLSNRPCNFSKRIYIKYKFLVTLVHYMLYISYYRCISQNLTLKLY